MLSVYIALAPAVFVEHTTSAALREAAEGDYAGLIEKIFGLHYFMLPKPYGTYPTGFNFLICLTSKAACDALAIMETGIDPSLVDDFIASQINAHMPSGTSIRNMQMWSQ